MVHNKSLSPVILLPRATQLGISNERFCNPGTLEISQNIQHHSIDMQPTRAPRSIKVIDPLSFQSMVFSKAPNISSAHLNQTTLKKKSNLNSINFSPSQTTNSSNSCITPEPTNFVTHHDNENQTWNTSISPNITTSRRKAPKSSLKRYLTVLEPCHET